MNNVNTAFHAHQQQTQQFDGQSNSFSSESQRNKYFLNIVIKTVGNIFFFNFFF